MTKTQSKHTPGPWYFNRFKGDNYYVSRNEYGAPRDGRIAALIKNKEDARLIAAAPELLEALEFALKALYAPDCPAIPDGAMVKGKIYNAIAKAKGE